MSSVWYTVATTLSSVAILAEISSMCWLAECMIAEGVQQITVQTFMTVLEIKKPEGYIMAFHTNPLFTVIGARWLFGRMGGFYHITVYLLQMGLTDKHFIPAKGVSHIRLTGLLHVLPLRPAVSGRDIVFCLSIAQWHCWWCQGTRAGADDSPLLTLSC